ncbi:hypothetical protein [Bradyrhizobium erythrophlei]|uniref:Uncharacterized protein n=1 Tax=Bradyrhizobium erythrophlei TaxID=1437360 RepID=A0A1H4NYE2_9BRAD|nr:hypothetical protein [Bradyrhizobium erythrophlei]SEC00277.1 hypothetical protein SAMN05444164_0770 [Bradyrhizobium erythrophlei]
MTSRLIEGLSGTLFFLLVFACTMFVAYMTREILQNGFHRTRLQAAISIFVLLFFQALIFGPVWWMCHIESAGAAVNWDGLRSILIVSSAGEILGIVCVIRVFAPDSWGRNIWFISSLVAAGLAAAFFYV